MPPFPCLPGVHLIAFMTFSWVAQAPARVGHRSPQLQRPLRVGRRRKGYYKDCVDVEFRQSVTFASVYKRGVTRNGFISKNRTCIVHPPTWVSRHILSFINQTAFLHIAYTHANKEDIQVIIRFLSVGLHLPYLQPLCTKRMICSWPYISRRTS
jgi:hypothetical protein